MTTDCIVTVLFF